MRVLNRLLKGLKKPINKKLNTKYFLICPPSSAPLPLAKLREVMSIHFPHSTIHDLEKNESNIFNNKYPTRLYILLNTIKPITCTSSTAIFLYKNFLIH